MRNYIFIFLPMIFMLTIFGCKDQNTLEVRLDEFYTLLDIVVIDDFENGDLKSAENYIENNIKYNQEYIKFFEKLKQKEVIDLFNTKQVVYYYYKFFYLQIKKNNNDIKS